MRTDAEARRVAKAVADSPLVKTALFGADPNWGRIVSAAGYAGVEFDEKQLSLLARRYLAVSGRHAASLRRGGGVGIHEQHREVNLRLVFPLGRGRCTFCTCDLTYDYVKINADYTT